MTSIGTTMLAEMHRTAAEDIAIWQTRAVSAECRVNDAESELARLRLQLELAIASGTELRGKLDLAAKLLPGGWAEIERAWQARDGQ